MLRRVEDQRRVENGEAERREDLNEEQHGRSLRSRCETAFEKFHPVFLCRLFRRVLSSGSKFQPLRSLALAARKWSTRLGLSLCDGAPVFSLSAFCHVTLSKTEKIFHLSPHASLPKAASPSFTRSLDAPGNVKRFAGANFTAGGREAFCESV